MMKNISQTLLVITLILGQWLSTYPAYSAEESGGITDTLNRFNSGVTAVGGAVGQIGQRVNETQMMAQQMANLGSFAQNMGLYGQQRSTFEQVRAQLAQTLMQGSQCLQSKLGKETDADMNAKISVTDMLNSEVSCVNAEALETAGRANLLKIDHASKRMICLQNMQNQLEAGAKNITAPFTQLTTAAAENVAQRNQIIDQYKKIGEKIENDLNGRDGYRANLAELKSMRKSLIDALSKGNSKRSAVVGDESLSTNLGKRLDDLKKRRNLVANAWHKQIMTNTMNCFQHTTIDCGDGGSPASPLECVRRQISRAAANSPTQRAFNQFNKEEINRALRELNTMLIRKDKSAKLDANNVEEFKKFSKERFSDITDRTANVFEKRTFKGNVAKSEIVSFVKASLDQCYNDGLQEFESSLKSETNELYSSVKTEEKDIATDINKWLQTATDKMNAFRTKFTKIFSAELPQFANTCQAGDDPYLGYECLRNLQKALNDGIDGTNNEAVTTMNVPTVTTDQSGKVTQSNRNFQCKGFEECLNMLEQAKDFNKQQADVQKAEKENFVKNHNTTIDTAIGGISAQISTAFGQMGDTITKFNQELAGIGIANGLGVKTIDGEQLTKDEHGLFKQPKNMLAALAGKGSISKMEKVEDVQKAIGSQRDKVIAFGQKANAMKNSCAVTPNDYARVKSAIPSCESPSAVCGKIVGLARYMEVLVQKTQPKYDPKAKLAGLEDLNECKRDLKDDLDSYNEDTSEKEGESYDECVRLAGTMTGAPATEKMKECNSLGRKEKNDRKEARRKSQITALRQCLQSSAMKITDLNNTARKKSEKETFTGLHSELTDLYSQIADHCPITSKDDEEKVKSACSSLRDKLESKGGGKKSDSDEDEGEPVKDAAPRTGSTQRRSAR